MNKLFLYHFYSKTKIKFINDNFSEEVELNERAISAKFYPPLFKILEKNSIDIKDINQLSFINGPGSFTSLRFFLTFSKALYVSNPKITFIPINLMDMIAFNSNNEDIEVVLGGDRKFNKFFHYSKYNKSKGELKTVVEPKMVLIDEIENLKTPPIYMGIDPNFEIKKYIFNFDHMDKFSKYIIDKGDNKNLVTLTPFYCKPFSMRGKFDKK